MGALVGFMGSPSWSPLERPARPSVGWCQCTAQETSPYTSKMKLFFLLALFFAAAQPQVNFGDSSSSSSSSSSSKVSADTSSVSEEGEDGVNTRFFGLFKPKPKPKPVWRPKPQQQSHRPTNSCGRRRRQAVQEDEEQEGNSNSRSKILCCL